MEHQVLILRVGGSSPSPPSKFCWCSSVDRASVSYSEGHRFESDHQLALEFYDMMKDIVEIYHSNCPSKPTGEAPVYKYGGFSMGDCCTECGDTIMVYQHSDK